MKFAPDGSNYLARFERGERLMVALTTFVREQNITGAWLSGLGAAEWAELGYYDMAAKQYQWRKFDTLLEILSLQGNVAWQQGEPVIHLHGTFSDQHYQVVGGHVKDLQVGGTCELFIQLTGSESKLKRLFDQETGLNLLEL